MKGREEGVRRKGKLKDAERNWKALLSKKQRKKRVSTQKEMQKGQKERDCACEVRN